MNSSIFWRGLIDRRKSTIVIAVSLALFALMYASLFKSMASQMSDYVDAIPKGFEAAFGDLSAASTPEGWLHLEFFSLFMPFAAAITAISFGAGTIGKEEESGTLELLLASPISRFKIITQKALSLLAQAGIIALVGWLGVALGTLLFEFDISLVNVFWASVSVWLLAAVFGLFALAAQSIRGSRSFGIGAAAGLLAATYAAQILSQLLNSLHFLRYFSPFYYFDTQSILSNGPSSPMLVLAGLAVIFYAIAFMAFNNRDTGV